MSEQSSSASIERAILAILGEVVTAAPAGLDANTDLFNSGIIDSFNMIEIIEHLEERF